MSIWNWQTWNGVEYLTCNLLNPWPHGFFTRQFWPHIPDRLVHALAPDAQVCRVKQVHGNLVLTGSQMQAQFSPNPDDLEDDRSPFPEADGLLSDSTCQALWVCSADCTPALIGDRSTGQVAAVHAGWRGTAARIVPRAVEQLLQQGSQLQDLVVAMGPAIAGEVYQVTEAVALEMARSLDNLLSDRAPDPTALLQTLLKQDNPPLLADSEPGRVRLDVRRINAMQLEALGLEPDQIAIAPHCTFQDPERFFSYRRDGLRKVQWSGIVSQ